MSSFRILLAAAMFVLPIVAGPSAAEAARYRAPTGQVVHTRRLPVVLHRLVPPQYGRHQYAGRRR